MRDYATAQKKQARTQRLRSARKKLGRRNHDKKPRQNKWDPNLLDEWDDLDYETTQRIVSRGANESRQMIEKIAQEIPGNGHSPAAPAPSPDSEGTCGLVVEVNGSLIQVSLDGQIRRCTLRGALKNQTTGFTNPIAVGDQVMVSPLGAGQGVIETILPRRSVLARPYMPDKGKSLALQQIVAANVDQLLIVASWREPNLWPELIDRYLVTAQRNQLKAVICINKIDLVTDQAELAAALQPYYQLGYPVLTASAAAGTGLEALEATLRNRTTVLAGLSGVGKSSLLTAIQPDFQLRTRSVTAHGLFTGQGRHTTTSAVLLQLENGGRVVDTPGIREFGLVGVTRADLAAWFPEIARLLGNCRYRSCTHTIEPDCAVQTAAAAGQIAPSRYKSYCLILETLPA